MSGLCLCESSPQAVDLVSAPEDAAAVAVAAAAAAAAAYDQKAEVAAVRILDAAAVDGVSAEAVPFVMLDHVLLMCHHLQSALHAWVEVDHQPGVDAIAKGSSGRRTWRKQHR